MRWIEKWPNGQAQRVISGTKSCTWGRTALVPVHAGGHPDGQWLSRTGLGHPGGRQVDREPAMCPCGKEANVILGYMR